MSKRIIRPEASHNNIQSKQDDSIGHENKFGTHKYNFNRDVGRKVNNTSLYSNLRKSLNGSGSLLNTRFKAKEEFGKNLHVNRDTSDDNVLKFEHKPKMSKVLKNFTHSHKI